MSADPRPVPPAAAHDAGTGAPRGDAAIALVVDDGERAWTPDAFDGAVRDVGALLEAAGAQRVATWLDNGVAFAMLDEALRARQAVHVPLPPFFTPAQVQHALAAAGVDRLVAAPAVAAAWPALPWQAVEVGGQPLRMAALPRRGPPPALPPGTAVVTFTSGTTGEPKGVCLTAEALDRVADGLVQALAPLDIGRHLCALPFGVLLEHIAGWLAPRRHGTTVVVRPLASLGVEGAARFDPARFDAAVRATAPQSLILLPQMLRAWCGWMAAHRRTAPPSLRLVAVGGAAVGAALVGQAKALGLPVGEGWGLSEGASVQTLNLPGAERPGSVGRPLPHARVRVAEDGELWIAGALFAGYLGDPAVPGAEWPTGDLGHVDADGFVHITGRRRHVLITAFGRNVSPEWVEMALQSQPAIAQAVVGGDGRPSLGAVIWPVRRDADDLAVQSAVDAANARLPDYARIAAWVRADLPFDAASGQATANGRPRREAIWQRHGPRLWPDTAPGAAPAPRPAATAATAP